MRITRLISQLMIFENIFKVFLIEKIKSRFRIPSFSSRFLASHRKFLGCEFIWEVQRTNYQKQIVFLFLSRLNSVLRHKPKN
jgi:hypothetical protein